MSSVVRTIVRFWTVGWWALRGSFVWWLRIWFVIVAVLLVYGIGWGDCSQTGMTPMNHVDPGAWLHQEMCGC